MKTKLLLVAIVVCMLVSAIAFPVLAAVDVTMWVSRARLAYVGRSSTGPDAVVGLIHFRDATKAKVEGVMVTATWTLPDGTVLEGETAVTDHAGIARFSVWEGGGVYKLCVDGATKEGWLYDPDLDRETCPVLTVP